MITDAMIRAYLDGGMRDTFTSRFAEALATERALTKKLKKDLKALQELCESKDEALDMMERGLL